MYMFIHLYMYAIEILNIYVCKCITITKGYLNTLQQSAFIHCASEHTIRICTSIPNNQTHKANTNG